jgi:hypothetical protein
MSVFDLFSLGLSPAPLGLFIRFWKRLPETVVCTRFIGSPQLKRQS